MDEIAHRIEDNVRSSDIKLADKVPFSKMILTAPVRKGLNQSGYTYPTVIQANAIPIGKAGIDLLVQSKSGTGKTLIFCTILLEAYQKETWQPQSLILVPTREIAVQIEANLNKIGRFCEGFKAVSVIGGMDITEDRKRLQNAKTIVGTPGRVLHLIVNNVLNTSKIKLFIIDEADKMMSQSFRTDFHKIYNSLPCKKQTIACSATFCESLDQKLVKFMRNPLLISTDKRATLLVGIKQFVCVLSEEKTSILEMTTKLTMLKKIFTKISYKQCLAFTSSQSRAESYRNTLEKENWPCEVITGAQDQKTRLDIFNKFQNFKIRILLATDLMSRGIDSENVNLVINLEVPDDGPTYLHRIGRAGRFGSHGIAITFLSSDKDKEKFIKILKSIGTGMEVLRFPENNIPDLWNEFNAEEDGLKVLEKFEFEIQEENIDANANETVDKIIETFDQNVNIVNENNTKENQIDVKSFNDNIDKNFENIIGIESKELHSNFESNKSKSTPISTPEELNLEDNKIKEQKSEKETKQSCLYNLLIDEKTDAKKITKTNIFDEYEKHRLNNLITDVTNDSQLEENHANKTTISNKQRNLSKIKALLIDSDKSSTPKNIFDDYESYQSQQNTENNSQPSTSAEQNKIGKTKTDEGLKNTGNCLTYTITDQATVNNLSLISSTTADLDISTSSRFISDLNQSSKHSDNEIEQRPAPHNSPARARCTSPSDTESDSLTTSTDRSSSISTIITTTTTNSRTQSSGFIENTTSGASSGIVTTTEYSDTDDDYNSTDSTFDSGRSYQSSEDHDNIRIDFNSTCQACAQYQNDAFHNWTKLYFNQLNQIQEYVNYSRTIRNKNLQM